MSGPIQDASLPILITGFDEAQANKAYARYCALRLSERADPTLTDEECFQILVSDAWAAFIQAFWRLS
jgi:hypothetical protein